MWITSKDIRMKLLLLVIGREPIQYLAGEPWFRKRLVNDKSTLIKLKTA